MALTPIHSIDAFSPHLFWDVDKSKLDFENNKEQIILQVLEYGLLTDWLIVKNIYGVKRIGEIATGFRQLEPRALSFIVALTGLPKESFRCYTTKQWIPSHWNF